MSHLSISHDCSGSQKSHGNKLSFIGPTSAVAQDRQKIKAIGEISPLGSKMATSQNSGRLEIPTRFNVRIFFSGLPMGPYQEPNLELPILAALSLCPPRYPLCYYHGSYFLILYSCMESSSFRKRPNPSTYLPTIRRRREPSISNSSSSQGMGRNYYPSPFSLIPRHSETWGMEILYGAFLVLIVVSVPSSRRSTTNNRKILECNAHKRLFASSFLSKQSALRQNRISFYAPIIFWWIKRFYQHPEA